MRAWILSLAAVAGCSDDDKKPASPVDAGADGGDAATDAGAPDAGEDAGPPSFCEAAGLAEREWSDGPYGSARHDVADDFSVPLVGGAEWSLRAEWTGCESYVFVPDTIANSALDATSIWDRDVDRLIEMSPRNVHYFFVSRLTEDWQANASTSDLADQIDNQLGALSPEDAAHWRAHLHVVQGRAATLGNWVGDLVDSAVGRGGFGIDRFQRVRGLGSFSDVVRFSGALQAAGHWPWESNLGYAAHEARAYNYEAVREEGLDPDATVVDFWSGEVLEEFEEIDVELPSAAEMAGFDTLEIDVTSRCPNPDAGEFGNCGAWDYLAHLHVYDGAELVEVGRFITSYHRETRWVLDVTPMLVLLRDGGTRRFRWSFAPSWNTQPTATWLSLRFSNRGKGVRPVQASFLWAGGGFNSAYNDGRTPIDVPVPADAERVELWALITGHGGETNNCAEFCDHEHEFTVNGSVHLHDHPAIGDDEGCVAAIEDGTTPNQWGTWWFGRGGWCPGQHVPPFVADVTGDVTPGEDATISYRGLFDGETPPDASGNIVMSSWLVVYR
jgi:hypothetical protein